MQDRRRVCVWGGGVGGRCRCRGFGRMKVGKCASMQEGVVLCGGGAGGHNNSRQLQVAWML